MVTAAFLSAQEESSSAITNPFNTAEDRADGARTYLSQCASCHGRDGKGGQGTPDLTTGVFKRASSDEGLFALVNKGIPGTAMPGFNLNSRQIWQTLAYIRSLSPATGVRRVTGDPARGAQLFRANGCAKCHDSGNAPALPASARYQSAEEIRRAVTDPSDSVQSQYWRMRGVTTSGQTVTGQRLNEDTFSVQFLDESGRLRSIRKSELSKYEIIRTSPMPSFQGKFSPQQMDDLTAYLISGGSR